ncbi:MAG: NUDIX hydrolase [Planctomycetota bacterium]
MYEWPRPMFTVDVAVFCVNGGKRQILLIKRSKDPFAGKWALPGGFVNMDEDLPDAAARELCEETGIRGLALKQMHTFGMPGRDPRGRTISTVFMGVIQGQQPQVRGGDDAAEARWFDIDDLPGLAFDHDEVTAMAIMRLSQ